MDASLSIKRMHETSYSVSLKSHMRHAWPIFVYASILLIVLMYVHSKMGAVNLRLYFLLSGVFALFFIPHLLLHLRYTAVSAGVSIDFRSSKQEIAISTGNRTETIQIADIEKVEMVMPWSVAHKELIVYPWQLYGYAVLHLTSGRRILITTLLVPDLEFPYEFQNVNVRIGMYCWPPSRER